MPTRRLHRARLILGLLLLSIPPAMAVFSFACWLQNSYAVLGMMIVGFWVGLPCVAVGFAVLPACCRGRVAAWASLPLLASFAVIFGLPQTISVA